MACNECGHFSISDDHKQKMDKRTAADESAPGRLLTLQTLTGDIECRKRRNALNL